MAQKKQRFLWERYRNVVATGTGESMPYPKVWQELKALEQQSRPEQAPPKELEVLVVSLMILPALRLLTL